MNGPSRQTNGKVLLTGGSGFVASHVLDCLLLHGFFVVVTVRSDAKGARIKTAIDESMRSNVSFVLVEDVSEEGAFDKAVQSVPPFDYVVHTASPYHFNIQDAVKDFLDPAIKGTTGILRSIKSFAPEVKRVVVTSSSAAMLNPNKHEKIYDETKWAPMTWDEAVKPENAYRASKVFSETAAWKFVEDEAPNFDLAMINCTYTFGPIQRQLPDLEAMNTSNQRIRDMIQGKMRDLIAPTAPVFTFVDVRDVALAHVRALTTPEAGGNRFYVVGGYFSNKRVADIVRNAHPELSSELPPVNSVDDFPEDVYGFDNSKSKRVLGLEYTSLNRSILDTVDSILGFRT